MKTAKAWPGARVIMAACFISACVDGCKSDASPNEQFVGDDGEGGGTGSSGGTAASSSSGGSGGAASAPSADYADGGIACGPGLGCAPSEECCYAAAPAGDGGVPGMLGGFAPFGGGAGAAATSCTPAGSCTGSSLACSGTQQCSGGQVCCFAYQEAEASAAAGPFGGFGAPMAFAATCADDCPGNDMIHYQLCASSSDCPSGQQCVPGTYTTYCAGMGGAPAGGPPDAEIDDDGGSD
jgi:hypothetical protein